MAFFVRSFVTLLNVLGLGLQLVLPAYAADPMKKITVGPVSSPKILPKIPAPNRKIIIKRLTEPPISKKIGSTNTPGSFKNPKHGDTPPGVDNGDHSNGGRGGDVNGAEGGGYSYGGGGRGGFGGYRNSGSDPEKTSINEPRQVPRSPGSLLGSPFTFSAAAVNQESSNKDDDFVESGEISFAAANLQQAQDLGQKIGYPVIRRTNLSSLGFWISTVRVTGGRLAEIADELRTNYPEAIFSPNHRYGLLSAPRTYATNLIGWNSKDKQCGSARRIGMIDTAVDQNHPALRAAQIEIRSLLTPGTLIAAADHGTAVATILVGNASEQNQIGLLPQSRLHVINVFRKRDKKHVDTTAELIIRAIDALVGKSVDAINLSFGGASNPILEVALRSAIKRGVLVVAAAGNGGVASAPVYPAAYPGVIAVTAVDAQKQIYRNATRGEYISFAAPGVDVWTAASGGSGSYLSGTSFAVPFVTAIVVALRGLYPQDTSEALQKRLADSAQDLGEPGRDAIYGWGLVQTPHQCTQVVSQ